MRRACALAVCLVFLSACQPSTPEPAALRPVAVSTTEWAEAMTERSAPGVLRATNSAEQSFKANGQVIRRAVKLGQVVQQNDVLAELDDGLIKLEVHQAQSALNSAKRQAQTAQSQWQRDQQQFKAGLIAKAQLEQTQAQHAQAQAAYQQAQSQLASVKERLGYSQLLASQDGVIAEEYVQTGENVAAGQPIYRIEGEGALEVQAYISPEWAANLEPGQIASMHWQNHSVALEVKAITPYTQAAVQSAQVRFTVKAPLQAQKGLWAGNAVEVRWHQQTSQDQQIILPATALFHAEGQPAVWLYNYDTQHVQLQPVTVQEYGRDTITISDGLDADQAVVVKGAHTLSAHERYQAVDYQPRRSE